MSAVSASRLYTAEDLARLSAEGKLRREDTLTGSEVLPGLEIPLEPVFRRRPAG